jgi:hypothetical protein
MIVDRWSPYRYRGCSDPRSRDHPTGLSRDQADTLITDAHQRHGWDIHAVKSSAAAPSIKATRRRDLYGDQRRAGA